MNPHHRRLLVPHNAGYTGDRSRRSAPCVERHDDVRGVAVEVLASPVVDRCGAGIRVACGGLDVTQGNAGVEGSHDERSPEHVRVHRPETGSFADRPDPTMRGPTVRALTVAAAKDRSVVSFSDGEVDCSGGAGHERDECGLVALAEEHRECRVVMVVPFCGEEEHSELGAVQTAGGRRMDVGSSHVLRRVRRDATVDVREPVEATLRRRPTVDGGGSESSFFEPAAVHRDG